MQTIVGATAGTVEVRIAGEALNTSAQVSPPSIRYVENRILAAGVPTAYHRPVRHQELRLRLCPHHCH